MFNRRTTLTGRTVVITGAGSGIGRALAHRLSTAGCPVAIADVDEVGLKETLSMLSGACLTHVVDVRDAAAVGEFAAQVASWAPAPIGAVFNNADVALSASIRNGVSDDEDWLHEINYRGVVNGTRAFLPQLLGQSAGAIVNTSSVYGLIGVGNESAYCASKFAVRGFTESLRHELRGTGVRAVTIHPGGVKTNIARNGRLREDTEGWGRTPDDIAEEFEALAMTTPEAAADIIVEGVERGQSRILVGIDTKVIDALVRLAPTRYPIGIAAVQAALSSRAAKRLGTVMAR